ncbi:hypothetical protein [Streptomyces roseoviridis]
MSGIAVGVSGFLAEARVLRRHARTAARPASLCAPPSQISG